MHIYKYFLIFQKNNGSNMNSMFNSDDEEETIQSSIEQNHQRWSSMRYSDSKHINPRTGEILGTEKSPDIKNMSYDLKNIQPLTTNNDKFTNQKSAKENESPSQSSMKDSAYGSIDFKTTSPLAADNRQLSINEIHEQKAFPSQQLQQVLQKTQIKTSNLPIGFSHHKSPLPNSKLNFSKAMSPINSQFASRELIAQNKARSMNQSASSLTNFPRKLINQSENKNSPLFSSMKDSPYDLNGSSHVNRNNSEQYNSQDNTLNVVQGQMKINPYATTSTMNHNTNGKVMNPQMLQLESISNDDEITPNHIHLTESEMDSLMQIKKMLIETKTGLPE